MASARGGNFTAVHVWMIVFVVLFVASTTGLVIMFTGQEKLRADRDKAIRDKELLATSRELNDPAVVELRQYGASLAPSQPLVRVMLNDMQALAGRITGDNTHSRAMAEAQLDQLLDAIRSSGVVPSADQINRSEGVVRLLQRMFQWYADQSAALIDAKAQLAAAQQGLSAAQQAMKEMQTKFDESFVDIKKQVDDLQQTKVALETNKQTQLEELSRKLAGEQESREQLRKEVAQTAARFGERIRERDDIISQQLAKIGDVQGPGPIRAQDDVLAREPLGRVLRALPGDSLVHIDLGELDGVTLGMRFAVYSADRRVPADGRGKANIEAVNVGPHTSECRVVSPPGPDDPILEEDYAQNILLARNAGKKPRFCIVGAFDLDYDGRNDTNGVGKIRAYVERFGGEIVDDVDAATDFVVVGRKPAPVKEMTGKAVDPTAPPVNQEIHKADAEYESLVRRAELLGVPRLRQEAFLNFVGLEPGPGVLKRMAS